MVLEEIKMDEDNPEYLIHELFTQNFWRGHPLGPPDPRHAGNGVAIFRARPYWKDSEQWYAPNNMRGHRGGQIWSTRVWWNWSRANSARSLPASRGAEASLRNHTLRVGQHNKSELEQVHIVLGVPSVPLADERRYAASLLNTILGGGMSSRLFQNIRERQGLAYAVVSDLTPYTDSGVLSVYAGHAGLPRQQG